MLTLIVKLIFLLTGALIFNESVSPIISVVSILSALFLTSLNQYFSSGRFTAFSSAVYFAAGIFMPSFCPFLPLFCLDLFMNCQRIAVIFSLIPLVSHISGNEYDTALIFLLIVLAVIIQYICVKTDGLTEENKRIRDNGIELNRILMDKNEYLTEKQNYEIHLATLKERNRIAREIHDNVGHILSRSILQTGALQAVNKDEQTAQYLSGLKDTLTLAMNSIRNSVHDLRDESIDLYESIREMTEHLNYNITINYDVTQDLHSSIKYCFLSILKEALTNIAKHSDATHIKISVQEHPSMYQFLLHDNGTKKTLSSESAITTGMGISNMNERVMTLDGQFSASYQNGFRIFISIPKKEILDEHNTR